MKSTRPPHYARHRFPAEVISYAVWLYYRFPLSLRMVEEMLAARGILVSHETVRQWAMKFGQSFANQIRRRLPAIGDKWHLDEVVISIAGRKHWLWRAVDQHGVVLDILVQSRRSTWHLTKLAGATRYGEELPIRRRGAHSSMARPWRQSPYHGADGPNARMPPEPVSPTQTGTVPWSGKAGQEAGSFRRGLHASAD
jgi:putative transposase